MSLEDWYSGEYLTNRIIFTIILVFILILICISYSRSDEYKRLVECMKACYYCCFYKQAKIVPLILAIETCEPITYIAQQTPTIEVKVIWE